MLLHLYDNLPHRGYTSSASGFLILACPALGETGAIGSCRLLHAERGTAPRVVWEVQLDQSTHWENESVFPGCAAGRKLARWLVEKCRGKSLSLRFHHFCGVLIIVEERASFI